MKEKGVGREKDHLDLWLYEGTVSATWGHKNMIERPFLNGMGCVRVDPSEKRTYRAQLACACKLDNVSSLVIRIEMHV